MRKLGITGRSWRWVLWTGCVTAVVAACGSSADNPVASPEAIRGQDSVAGGQTTPAIDSTVRADSAPPTSPATNETSDVSKWEEFDLGPALGDDFISLTEHNGEIWLANPIGDRTAVEVRNLAGDRAHRFDISRSSAPPLLRSTPLGLLLITSDYENFRPKSWLSSDDGLTWVEGAITDRPFDPIGLTVVDGHLLAPGAFRPLSNPSQGPFTPGLFRSDDGVTWSEVELDRRVFDTTDGTLGPIVDQGDRMVTTSTRLVGDYFTPAMFESLDRGVTWQPAPDTGPVPSSFVAAGQTLVGVDTTGALDAAPIAINSSRTWSPVDISTFGPPFQFSSTYPLAGGSHALLTLSVEPTVEYCYENADACGRSNTPALLLIDANGSAVSVDLGSSTHQYATSALVRADGSLAVVTYNGDRVVIRTWDIANGPVPTLPPVKAFTPTGPPTVQWDSDIQIGQTYRFALYTHCGIDFLANFNGQHWWIVGAPSDAYDPTVSGDSQQILGEVTMLDADTIEYQYKGELIATYAPKPEESPGCA